MAVWLEAVAAITRMNAVVADTQYEHFPVAHGLGQHALVPLFGSLAATIPQRAISHVRDRLLHQHQVKISNNAFATPKANSPRREAVNSSSENVTAPGEGEATAEEPVLVTRKRNPVRTGKEQLLAQAINFYGLSRSDKLLVKGVMIKHWLECLDCQQVISMDDHKTADALRLGSKFES